jgi:hypothetical protein
LAPGHFGQHSKILSQKTKTAMEKNSGQELVAHVCNPSYSGGRDEEDCSSNSFQDPILKISNTKKCWQNGSSGGVPS